MFVNMTTEEIVACIAGQNIVNAINEYMRVTEGFPFLIIRKHGSKDCITINYFSVVKQDEHNPGDITIY